MLQKLVKIGLVVGLTVSSLSAQQGWYAAGNCAHIETVGMYSPNELITQWGCKPTLMGAEYAGAARLAMLAYDCQQTKLQTTLIFQYQTESECKANLKK